jgi:uncharacterized protein
MIWTFLFYAPLSITKISPYQMPGMILLILGGAGPSVIAVLLILFKFDKEERRAYWKSCFSIKNISIPMWFFIFLIFPLVFIFSIIINKMMGGAAPGMEQLNYFMLYPASIPFTLFISFMSGPWSEEFGWRGFALKPLIERFGNINGSVILGLIWGIWHLLLYFMPETWHGQMGFKFSGFWIFMISSVGLSFLMTWIFLKTNNSILSGLLMHFASNFTGQCLWPYDDRIEIINTSVIFFLGLILLLNYQKKNQARGVF